MFKTKKLIVCVVMVFAILSTMVVANAYVSSNENYSQRFSTTTTETLKSKTYSGKDISFTATSLSTNAPSTQTFYVWLYNDAGTQIGGATCTSDVNNGGLTFLDANPSGTEKSFYWQVQKATYNGYSVSGYINSTSDTL